MRLCLNPYFILIVLLAGMIISCRNQDWMTDDLSIIQFSEDTLKFDTVFTQTTSITQLVKIKNTGSQNIRLESIRLMGGDSSCFQLNIQGQAINQVYQMMLPAKDSIYIYVTVNIHPNDSSQPFIQTDRIEIKSGTRSRYIELEAYGQNAFYLRSPDVNIDTTWTNSKPIVIRGSLTIEPGNTLILEAGCKLYMQADAVIQVKGNLIIQGTVLQPVIIRGNRLDAPYRNLPGTWPGIIIHAGSLNNQFRFVKIEQAETAIAVLPGTFDTLRPNVFIEQSIIHHARTAGLDLQSNHVVVNNCLISQCGKGINITGGGRYRFNHNTVAGYSSIYMLHDQPVLYASDTRFDNGQSITGNLDIALINSIFWGVGGTVTQETVFEQYGSNTYRVSINHCLLKSPIAPSLANVNNLILNQDPLFDSLDFENNILDFRTNTRQEAPGIDQGMITNLLVDLDDQPRFRGAAPDLGCYEKP
jgi:hypothetical protein